MKEKHLLSFLLMELIAVFLFFLSDQENLNMIHHDSNIFDDIWNTIDVLPFIDFKLHWYLFLSKTKKLFITSFALSLIMISMLSLFEYITRSSSLSMEELNLFTVVG